MNDLIIGKTVSSQDQDGFTTSQFTLPPDVLTHTMAMMAKKGAGKSYAAGVIEEEFAKQGLPFVVLDPVGVHWGIRSSQSGKRSGFPVVVFGGDHGDLDIDRDMGTRVAQAVVEENISAIIDLTALSKTAWRIFTRDFCRELYRLNKTPRHVFIEEATEFVPQTRRPEMQEAYESVERIVRMGRNRGLGCTLIAQRSAQVAKDVLTQIDVLIALRTVGKHDRDALLDAFATVLEEDQLADLATFKQDIVRLEDGVAWVWSPEYLKCFTKIKVRERETYHAGATPTFEQVHVVQAKPDITALKARFVVVEETKTESKTPTANTVNVPVPCNHEQEIGSLSSLLHEAEQTNKKMADEYMGLEKKLRLAQDTVSKVALFRASLSQLVGDLPSVSVEAGVVDEEAMFQRLLARVPQNGVAVQITPPEALRKKYQEETVTRLYTKISGLDQHQRRVMEYLLGQGKFQGVTTISLALTGQDGGAGFTQTQTSLKSLRDAGLVRLGGSGGKLYTAIVDDCVAKELAVHSPSEGEISDVTRHVLARLVTA